MNAVYKLAKQKVMSDDKAMIKDGIVDLEGLSQTVLNTDDIFYYIAYGYKKLGNTRAFYEAVSRIQPIDDRTRALYEATPDRTKQSSFGRIIATTVLIIFGATLANRSSVS